MYLMRSWRGFLRMNDSPFALPWLLPEPPYFKTKARAALAASSLDEVEVRKLGAYASDLTGLDTLGKVVRKHRVDLVRKAGLTPFRLGIASSHNMNLVASALPGTGLRHNLVLDVFLSELGQDPQQLFGPESEFGRAALDAIMLALDYNVLGLSKVQSTPEEAELAVRGAIDYVAELAAGVRGIGTTCILQTLVPPASSLFGSLDGRVPGSVRAMVEQFNERLRQEVALEEDLVVDAAFLASAVGLSAWNHERDWNNARLPGALDSTPLYADHICRLVGAARGRARKCLVMALDDTLWGGAIEEVGLEGIRLGPGTSVGVAHAALQRYILDLHQRGVILAVCCHNAEASARLPFQTHPEMVLTENHLALFCANRSDKASNIREIAATLNIGTDSIVFLDNNPAERALVREALPEVAVPSLTGDPAYHAALLSRAGYFEAATVSRRHLGLNFHWTGSRHPGSQDTNLDGYLQSLNMVATISPLGPAIRTLVTRLIGSTNQFNLTSSSYSEQDVEELETSQDKYCLRISLADRFGDKGMVSLLVFNRMPEEWSCDTWVMSSRAFGRRVEELALDLVAGAASAAGALRLTGTYLPSTENALVREHFGKLGFTKISDLSNGGSEWALELSMYRPPVLPISVMKADSSQSDRTRLVQDINDNRRSKFLRK